jgi:DNA polymerase-3 subunit epsilon
VVDALTLFHGLEPWDVAAAVRRYCGRDLGGAHRANVDVAATAAVLDALLGRQQELPRHVDELYDLLVEVDIEGWFRGAATP